VITTFFQKIRKSVLARNSAWTFAGQGTSLVIQALHFVALARLLGSSRYGVFVGATALATMVSQYASMGSGLVFLRYVSPNRSHFAEYWGNVLLCTLTISIVLVLGIQAFGPRLVNRESASILLLVAVGECFCVQLTTCCGQVFQSFEKMRVTASITVLTNLLRLTVAVKFDLFNNAGEGNNSTGLYTKGAPPKTPATTFGGGVNLHSGDTFQVHMTYDGTTLTMTITDMVVTTDTFTISWPINIPATMGGNTAYVGFTAGTGGSTAQQEIITWAFN